MIDSWKILSLLKEYYAPKTSDEELLPLCEAVSSELSSRIKSDTDPKDIRLITAAAAIVNYKIIAKSLYSEDGISSFRAGDVAIGVSSADSLEIARKDRDEALFRALPLLVDDEFFFGRVSI